jgi:hypothetical protein
MNKSKILLSLLLISLIGISNINAEEVFPQGDSRYATKDAKIEAAIPFGSKVFINSAEHLSGRIYIAADSTGRATIDYKKILKTPRESEAIRYAEAVNVIMEKIPEGIRLLLQAPNPAPWSGTDNAGSIEAELHLPANCQIEINAIYFDIVIEGPFKSVSNSSSFGRLEAGKITEYLSLTTNNQDIIARDIAGEIKLITSNGDIRLNNLSSLLKPAIIRNENGSIIINQLTGSFDIDNSYGKIKLEQLNLIDRESRISGSYSPIRVEVAEISGATLNIANNNEDVDIWVPKSISARFNLKSKSGSQIDVVGLPIRPKRVDRDRLEFVTSDGNSHIIVSINGDGSITIHGQ